MKLTWLGHACFRIESDGYVLVLDPYEEGSVNGLKKLEVGANEVICSHDHGDHNAVGEVKMLLNMVASPFTITTIDSYHDEVKGKKRGPNKITIIDDGESKVSHLGDVGCELTSSHIDQLQGLDALLIPVGGFYTIDGKQAKKVIEELNPKIAIPMHYRNDEKGFGFDEIADIKEFIKLVGEVEEVDGSSIDTTLKYSHQAVVLTPANL